MSASSLQQHRKSRLACLATFGPLARCQEGVVRQGNRPVLLIMLVAPLAIGAVKGPSYFACKDSTYPFCNTSLSIDARVDDLIGRLTLEEKAALITPNPALGST